jgi:hypothetical protein
MKFTRTQTVDINEKQLANDLYGYLYEALCYQDCDFADDIAEGDHEFEKLAMLNKIGEIWHEEFLQYIIDNKITSEKRA